MHVQNNEGNPLVSKYIKTEKSFGIFCEDNE